MHNNQHNQESGLLTEYQFIEKLRRVEDEATRELLLQIWLELAPARRTDLVFRWLSPVLASIITGVVIAMAKGWFV